MRRAGRITDWNDGKGFGFVVPHDGGPRTFVHINAFQRGSRPPVAGDLISYLPAVDARGRTNAREVRHAGQRIEAPRVPCRIPRVAIGLGGLTGGAVAAISGLLPVLLIAAYFVLSILSYFMYAIDKGAATRNGQRTPEANFHLVDLLGGWPGALIAQQQFHHKTLKPSFQQTFWISVALNLAAMALLQGTGLLAILVGIVSGR